jgi:short-subunit dehydrogenase
MKSVFITGASSGMGKMLAHLYSKAGWRVGVCARRIDLLQNHFKNSDILIYEADVSSLSSITKAIDSFSHQGLDLVIANAGVAYEHKNKIPDIEVGTQMVMVNLLGTMNTFDAALKYMLRKKSGQLAAISSVAGFNGLPGVSAYAATKGGVRFYCETLNLDLAEKGINVTCLAPGFFESPITQKNPHPMPFMMPLDVAAKKVMYAIEKKKIIYGFPWQYYFVVKFLSFLPRCLYSKIMSLKIFNFSKEAK